MKHAKLLIESKNKNMELNMSLISRVNYLLSIPVHSAVLFSCDAQH